MTTLNNSLASSEDLALINTYSRSPLSAEEVYCFNITLCDNEIDRDFERFSLEGLTKLKELFVGKTGISDHSMTSKNQKARIFKTWIETNNSKKTTAGESYTCLKARAYMLKTAENEEMICEIEGGIKKEVSIGCAMKESFCSICGKSLKNHACNHIKGKFYGKKQCHGILTEATDAYEWSFVAVPAQRNAGVTKSFSEDITEKLYGENEKIKKELSNLKAELKNLQAEAADGKLYKSFLKEQVKKYALISMPKVDISSLMKGLDNMTSGEIKAFSDSLKAQAKLILPLTPQLKPIQTQKSNNQNNQFII